MWILSFFFKAYVKHVTSTVFRMFVKILVALALLLKQYIKISLLPNFKTRDGNGAGQGWAEG